MSISLDSCEGYQEPTNADDHEEPRLETEDWN